MSHSFSSFVTAKLEYKTLNNKFMWRKFFRTPPLNYLKIRELKIVILQIFQLSDNQQLTLRGKHAIITIS